jgi:hypothetical protein
MADITLSFAAKELADTPGQAGLLTQVNAALSALLDRDISGFDFYVNDKQRRGGRQLNAILNHDLSTAPPLTSPFVLRVETGQTLAAAVSLLNQFKALNPSFWFSPGAFTFINEVPGPTISSYYVWVIYSADPLAGSHWDSSGAVLAGDVTGPSDANTVIRIRNKNTPVPLVGGARLVFDITTDSLVWYSTPVYSSLAAAAADQANQILGERIIIFNTPAGAEDGTYSVQALTGSPADYAKISDATDTAAEVGIVDAGGYYQSNNVEGALQEIGAGTSGNLTTALVANTPTTVASVLVDAVRSVVWDVLVQNPATGEAERWTVESLHNGTATTDAATVDFTVNGLGPNTGNISIIAASLNGAGPTQTMRLQITATAANWAASVKTIVAAPAT